jgi:ABC-type transport system involved in multi-copper enzyme maturation permease subunit
MNDVLASFRAEWLKLSRRPATWVLGLVLMALLLTLGYGFVFLLVVVLSGQPPNRPGVQSGLHTLKPQLYPAHFLQIALGAFSGIGYGSAIAVILGVLSYGSEYGWSTLKTVFTQRPGRLATLAGKLLALALSLAVYSLAVLAVAAAAAAVFGAAYGTFGGWPGIVDVLKAFGAAWLIMGLWAALGVLFAVLFRQAALAIGLGVVYSIAVEGLVINTLSLVSSLTNVRRAFPGANATALVSSFGANAAHALVGPSQAALVLMAYLVVFLLIGAAVLRWRDVT